MTTTEEKEHLLERMLRLESEMFKLRSRVNILEAAQAANSSRHQKQSRSQMAFARNLYELVRHDLGWTQEREVLSGAGIVDYSMFTSAVRVAPFPIIRPDLWPCWIRGVSIGEKAWKNAKNSTKKKLAS